MRATGIDYYRRLVPIYRGENSFLFVGATHIARGTSPINVSQVCALIAPPPKKSWQRGSRTRSVGTVTRENSTGEKRRRGGKFPRSVSFRSWMEMGSCPFCRNIFFFLQREKRRSFRHFPFVIEEIMEHAYLSPLFPGRNFFSQVISR